MSFFDFFRAPPKPLEPRLEVPPPDTNTQGAAVVATERRNRKRQNARQGATALIIDDSPTVVAALRKILRSAGYVTRDAGDAEQGLAILTEVKVDLIFLDIVLPGMNGFGALRAIRKNPLTQHIPVVMISGNEHATEQFYANRIGADDFMKKPFSRFEVFAHIDALLDANQDLRRKGSTGTPTAPSGGAADPAHREDAIAPQPYARAAGLPGVAPAAPPPPAAKPPEILPELAARKELTAMGLQYFDQAQFFAAIQRGDQLAVTLFITGRGISLHALLDGKTPLSIAREVGNQDIIKLLSTSGAVPPAGP